MQKSIQPAKGPLTGAISLPGDKSISHRYAMISAIADGPTRIQRFPAGGDNQSTLRCMEQLGIQVERLENEVVIHGKGLDGLSASSDDLDCGNSGSTMRMLSGILAAQPFVSTLFGDESLSSRPMDRIMKPLAEMGAEISAHNERFPPLRIEGRKLNAIRYKPPMASAQVKSCVLLAGLFCEGETIVEEAIRTRDHTEIVLREFGADIKTIKDEVILQGRPNLVGNKTLIVPGDISSAAFFLVAALLIPGSNLSIYGVGLNPTRSALLDFLASIGAQCKILDIGQSGGEVVGDIQIKHAPIKGGVLEGAMTAALIDEIPVLSVLGAMSEEGLTVKDAKELRVKETDRIATVAENLGRMGVKVEVEPAGFHVPGKQKFKAAQMDSFHDHRIAMAFAIASLAADGPCLIDRADAASVSFPEFYSTLEKISAA
jgi:3-phosphoshikimate 1-carboxyvinyltransferase